MVEASAEPPSSCAGMETGGTLARPTALGYLGIDSPNAARWLEFGPEILGFDATASADGTVHLRLDDRHHRVAIHPAPHEACAYYGWEVANLESFEAAVDGLKQLGLELRDGTADEVADRRVRRMVWLLDGDGFRHEFFYGQEADPNAFQPRRPIAGYETGSLGLGHIAMAVSDLRAARRFFVDVGFACTDEIDAHLPLLFFHLGPRHHSLALGERPGSAGLLHLALSVRDIDDLGTTLDLCEERGVPIRRTIGRHTNDRVISFYLGTPSGFDIELGFGAIEVNPGQHVTTVMTRASLWGHKQVTPSAFLPPASAVSES